MTNLERWNSYNSDLESPQLFIDYTWLATISAALQRRVAIGGIPSSDHDTQIYPNIYVIFIGPPSIGKTRAAREAMRIMSSHDYMKDGVQKQLIKRAPNSITLEQLTRFLHTHYTTNKIPPEIVAPHANGDPKIYTHSSLAFFCGDELGTLIKENTNDLVIFLNQGWDCGDFHRETKTQGVDFVKNMCITFIGSATMEWVKHSMNSRLLGEGFVARAIFVYGDKKRKLVFQTERTAAQLQVYDELKVHVKNVAGLFGELKYSPSARAWLQDWYMNKNTVLNEDKRLASYYGRKPLQLRKIAMAFHFSEHLNMTLEVESFEKALALLNATELDMDKALAGSGRNALNSIAGDIVQYVKNQPEQQAEHKRLLLDFYDSGTMEEILQILDFLAQTGQLAATQGVGGLSYKTVAK